jgi:F0F1-type ATP synthase membrane subunit c/vacuolar-type H+-ATPase subunit K
MFAIGLAVGIALYKMGLIQKITGKLFAKKGD